MIAEPGRLPGVAFRCFRDQEKGRDPTMRQADDFFTYPPRPVRLLAVSPASSSEKTGSTGGHHAPLSRITTTELILATLEPPSKKEDHSSPKGCCSVGRGNDSESLQRRKLRDRRTGAGNTRPDGGCLDRDLQRASSQQTQSR